MDSKSREEPDHPGEQAAIWEPLLPVCPPGQTSVEIAGETFLPLENNRYAVLVGRIEPGEWPAMLHLSIRRLDREAIHDWRELQRIKNEVVGPEHEAVELYPAEDRLMDAANQYHLWVLEDPKLRFPFGYRERIVSESNVGGARQRPWPADARPADLTVITEEDMRRGRERGT
jgi:hypothetical protein